MKPAPSLPLRKSTAPVQPLHVLFALFLGSTLGLALLKFGNPVILDRMVERPQELFEYIFQPWPVRWGYGCLIVCAVIGLTRFQQPVPLPKWVPILLVTWFVWQLLASATTVDQRLSTVTLVHFGACVLCFFLGWCGLGRVETLKPFWLPLVLGLALVLWMGFEQHYGGLEATRKMFYQQPNWQQFPAEYIKKIESNRIFSTLVYPNALAAAILLVTPITLVTCWNLRVSRISRGVLTGALFYGAVACLFWTGSRSGWLISLGMAVMLILRQNASKRLKISILCAVVLLGLTGFFVKFAGYFRKGAPSVSARFEYWKAGIATAVAHPVFGTGPGTFSIAYRKIKPPDAEMAQLAHNDYLEQASDSGIVGLLSYAAFVIGSVFFLANAPQIRQRPEPFAVWLGVAAWAAQSFVEFPLYIPALAWLAFTWLGWLWAQAQGQRSSPPT